MRILFTVLLFVSLFAADTTIRFQWNTGTSSSLSDATVTEFLRDQLGLSSDARFVVSSKTDTFCFIAGTPILMAGRTAQGGPQHKNVEDIVAGDQVLGLSGEINTVAFLLVATLGSQSIVALDGGNPFVTNRHPLIGPIAGSRYVVDLSVAPSTWSQLEVGTNLYLYNGNSFDVHPVTQIQSIPMDPVTPIYTLYLRATPTRNAGTQLQYAANGYLTYSIATTKDTTWTSFIASMLYVEKPGVVDEVFQSYRASGSTLPFKTWCLNWANVTFTAPVAEFYGATVTPVTSTTANVDDWLEYSNDVYSNLYGRVSVVSATRELQNAVGIVLTKISALNDMESRVRTGDGLGVIEKVVDFLVALT